MLNLIPKPDSSSTIKPQFPKKRKESSDTDIHPTQLALIPSSSSYRLKEERDLSDIQQDSMNKSFDNPHDRTYQPDMLDLVPSKQVFQKIPVPAELTAIYKSFFKYLKSPDKFQKVVLEIISEVHRIGVIIRAERPDDLLNKKKIKDGYLRFFI